MQRQPRPPRAARKADPRQRRWSKAEYYRLGELGFFAGQKAELLEGLILVTSPQRPRHFEVLERATEILRKAFGKGHHIRMQGSLDLGQHSEPEPDVAVILGKRKDHKGAHPTRAELIVEVSDSTLSSDRRRKGSLYARAGLVEYWILNLVRDQLEVYTRPQVDESRRYGHSYADREVFKPGDFVRPHALPNAAIAVNDLLDLE